MLLGTKLQHLEVISVGGATWLLTDLVQGWRLFAVECFYPHATQRPTWWLLLWEKVIRTEDIWELAADIILYITIWGQFKLSFVSSWELQYVWRAHALYRALHSCKTSHLTKISREKNTSMYVNSMILHCREQVGTAETLCNVVRRGIFKEGFCDIILRNTARPTKGGSREQLHNTDGT